ncbi:MAG: hypothetical protein F2607_01265 [Actinobacteria bacterium]|jgi:hypothetical protein|uniref:Unannotated protein n=1 Tax=freshwater metagenome TaxID=449393 RepID=A0A6J6G9D3_9ZZZZ|nr:hypothetical protein [Actinomycetota bacterium]MSZ92809.1 hypothetical protein [Actinomycetota bacterium]
MRTQSTRVSTRIRRGTVAVFVVAVAILATSQSQSSAITTPASTLTSNWLAAQVGPTGEVNISGATQSVVTQTMYVAQGLAATGEQRDALNRAMSYLSLSSSIDEWVTNDGSGGTVAPPGADLPERLAALILLVNTTRGNPRAFGTPVVDLVARAQAMYGQVVPSFYGYQEPWSSIQDQSLMVIALQAVGATPPAAAIDWLVNQQCVGGTNPQSSLGGWQAFRAPNGNVLQDCDAPDPINYVGADTNSTAFAVQALQLFGRTVPVASAVTFLQNAQATSGSAAGGFPWFAGGDVDANSTALVLQAITSMGQSPSSWSVGGADPLTALGTFQLSTPASDAGAFFASWNPGVPDLLASYQGVWGLSLSAFPFRVLPDLTPTADQSEQPAVPSFTG